MHLRRSFTILGLGGLLDELPELVAVVDLKQKWRVFEAVWKTRSYFFHLPDT